ncbi:hypothetical protein WSM22_23540 [Cytophagales bacterium WSM2-2]|nr:hypothetical protein WSM22_23540 [Cytophagales bacterium WSM2-2]
MRVELFVILLTCGAAGISAAQTLTPADSLVSVISSAPAGAFESERAALAKILGAETHRSLETRASDLIAAFTGTPTGAKTLALLDLGKIYENDTLTAWAIRFYREANKQALLLKNKHLEGLTLKSLSFIYYNSDLLTEAQKCTYDALRIFEDEKSYTLTTPLLYQATQINYKAGNYVNCIVDFESCLKSYEKISVDSISYDIRFSIMSGWNTVGLAYRRLSKFDKSLEAFQMALILSREMKNNFWVALVNGNKGYVLTQMGKLNEAIPFIHEDLRISKSYNQFSSACNACISLAEIYIKLNNGLRAKEYLDSARYFMKRTPESKLQFKFSFTKIEAKYYELIRDFPRAHQALKLQIQLNDSVNNEERAIQLAQVQARYNLERKENEIQLLAQSNQLQRKEIETQQDLIYGAVLLGIVMIIFLIYFLNSYRKVKKQNDIIAMQREDIEEKNSELEAQSLTLLRQNEVIRYSNQELESKVAERTVQLQNTIHELDTFLYHASHDIRRPISTLMGLENISRLDQNDLAHLFTHVAHTARDMDSMLFKLQMAYLLNQPVSDIIRVSLRNVVQEAEEKFDLQIQHFNIAFTYEEQVPVYLYASPSLLKVVFQNLIENAIHFRKPDNEGKPVIRVTSEWKKRTLNISVEDNGIGIEEKFHSRIFDLYFRGTERSKGNGVGLYLTKKAVEKMKGEIAVKSVYGKGSVFTISVPGDNNT